MMFVSNKINGEHLPDMFLKMQSVLVDFLSDLNYILFFTWL